MSSPKAVIQILMTGTQILGKAFLEAGRQAVKNAKYKPDGMVGGSVEAAGVRNATSGSTTDKLTRQHRMTLDEAHLILNTKRGEDMQKVLQNYEHLFKANSPAPPGTKPPTLPNGKPGHLPAQSHYLQSKIFRARERLEAEVKGVPETAAEAEAVAPTSPSSQPPPPPPPPGST